MSYTFAANTRFRLPTTRCCNCGASLGFSETLVHMPIGSRLPPDGERVDVVLRLPFCKGCEPTARRRPPDWLALVVLGLFGGIVLAIALANLAKSLALDMDVLLSLVVGLTTGMAAALAWRMAPQPRAPQTSWFAPVRLEHAGLSFLGGEVQRLSFAFTNPRYAAEFSEANAASIAAGGVKVRVVKR